MTHKQNVDHSELAKFEQMASTWWDKEGDFKPIHLLNPYRVNYIEQQAKGLFGKKVLDLGCGGGILSESLAKKGACVTGIDMTDKPLKVAVEHAKQNNLDINYIQSTIEAFSKQCQISGEKFDIICCLEMLEHVPDPLSIITSCKNILADDGLLFLSTINRTFKGWLTTIFGAEYFLRWVPKGTHEFDKFIKPSEMIDFCRQVGFDPITTAGYHFNPFDKSFYFNNDISGNYFAVFCKGK